MEMLSAVDFNLQAHRLNGGDFRRKAVDELVAHRRALGLRLTEESEGIAQVIHDGADGAGVNLHQVDILRIARLGWR